MSARRLYVKSVNRPAASVDWEEEGRSWTMCREGGLGAGRTLEVSTAWTLLESDEDRVEMEGGCKQ